MKLIQDIIKQIKDELVGKKIEKISAAHGSFLMFEFGDIIDIKYKDGTTEKRREWMLWLCQSAWRMEKQNKMSIGSLDKQEEILKVIPMLEGKKVMSIEIDENYFDITLVLSNEIVLKTFSAMLDDEQWLVYRPDGLTFTASTIGESTLEE